METEISNTIPLSEILSKIGFKPVRIENDVHTYISPLSIQKYASLKVNIADNCWFDDRLNQGGDMMSFIRHYLKCQGVGHQDQDAKRWLNTMFNDGCNVKPIEHTDTNSTNTGFHVEGTWPITYAPFIRYLKERCIPIDIASEYLRQVTVSNTVNSNSVAAIGFRNEDNGYLLRSQSLKGFAGPQAVTFIRGQRNDYDGFHIFYSIFDYLTVLTQRKGKKLSYDAIILNSWSCLRDAASYIHGFGYRRGYLWLDNSPIGDAAYTSISEFLDRQAGLEYVRVNNRYKGFKDLNQSHVAGNLDGAN